MSEKYDSAPDTRSHIARVAFLLGEFAGLLHKRAGEHDQSKLEEPEKSIFDEVGPRLKQLKYGTVEYQVALKELGVALEHHYANNSHHPQYFQEGVAGMSLLDLVEMLVDWKAASERMQDGGDILNSINFNEARFSISPQISSIFRHTAVELGWIKEIQFLEDQTRRMKEAKEPPGFAQIFDEFATAAHANSVNKGFWDDPETLETDGSKINLMHAELSEATEGLREGNPPDDKIPEFSSAEAELADCVIRIMDLSKRRGWRVGAAIVAKHAFNKTRPRKHGKLY